VTAAGQWNTDISALNSMSSVAIRYTFSTTTADSDPGPGVLRLNNATQNLATVVRMDLTDVNATDVTATLDGLDDSTSTIKGYLKVTHAQNPVKWILFAISAVASPSGYRNVTVAPVNWSSANPFVDGDPVSVAFTRTGDKGDVGPAWTGGSIANRAYTAPQNPAYAASLTVDAALSNVFLVGTLTGNVTTFTINNPADGQTINLRFVQDGTGGRTIAMPGSAAVAGSPNATANKVSWLTLTYVGGASRWEGAWTLLP
jgi:hypothetical protein